MNTIDRARHRWMEILPRLGIDRQFLQNKHGPCPLCGGKDRYRFDDKDGSGSYYCHQCGAGVGVILLRKLHGWDFKTACDEIDGIIGTDAAPVAPPPPQKPDQRRAEAIRRAIAQAVSPAVVDACLSRRGISARSPALLGDARCPYFDDDRRLVGHFPAMVAPILGLGSDGFTFLMATAFTAVVIATSRDYLAAEGASPQQADRMHAAFTKSVMLHVTAWTRPYVGAADW